MRGREALAIGLIASLIVVVGVAVVFPPIDDFELDNPFWNGFSEVNSILSPSRLSILDRLSALDPQKSALFIIGPSKAFTEQEAIGVENFLKTGGLVLLADDFGYGNNLLSRLGVGIRFSEFMVLDPLFRDVSSRLPRILDIVSSSTLGDLSALTFNYAVSLNVIGQGVSVLAYSTPFSYLDKNGNGLPDSDEPAGPFSVIAKVRYGGGVLIVVSDSSLFINGMLSKDDNRELLTSLAGSRDVYVEDSHWLPSLFTQFKLVLNQSYHFASISEIKYTILIMTLVTTFRFRWIRKVEEIDELREVLKAHPEWDRNVLIKLKQWRDKIGNQ